MTLGDKEITLKAVPRWRCRWWLRTRLVEEKAIDGPVVEFYVPWWAWMFEMIHRTAYGRTTLKPML